MEEKEAVLRESFEQFGVSLTDTQSQQFLKFAEMLVEWNQRMNLTAITDFREIIWKHFIDSISICKSRNVSRETLVSKMIDVGCGAGFPGIPLKILFPDIKLTCLDSVAKRMLFLQEVIKECKLKNVTVIHGRAEDFGQDAKFREQYRICVSRAVANCSTLSEYCLPFVQPGGIFVAYKAGQAQEEIAEARKAIKVFGGELETAEEFTIQGSDLRRTFVICRKVQHTPKKYPRKAGLPENSPIRG